MNHSRAQYLGVCKLAVLQVGFAVEGPDAGVGVVEGVFTHAVWETLLRKKRVIIIILKDKSHRLDFWSNSNTRKY